MQIPKMPFWAAGLILAIYGTSGGADSSGKGPFRVGLLQQITNAHATEKDGEVTFLNPLWSANGALLAYENLSENTQRLYIHRYSPGDTTHSVEVVSSEAGSDMDPGLDPGGFAQQQAFANFGLSWSSTGSFVYVGSGGKGYPGIYRSNLSNMEIKGYTLLAGGDDAEAYVDFPAYHTRLGYVVYAQGSAWAGKVPEGSRIDREARLSLFGMPEGIDIKKGQSPYPLGVETATDGDLSGILQLEPSFSPVGDDVVFTGIDIAENNNNIYRLNLSIVIMPRLTSLNVDSWAPLTKWPSAEGRPQWSPDGQYIAFLSTKDQKKNEWGLFVVDANGTTEPRKLVDRVINHDFPEWHPDGQHIFFVRQDEIANNPIQYINIHAGPGQEETLETGTSLHNYLDITPDGQRIAFCAKGRETDANLTWWKLYTADLKFNE